MVITPLLQVSRYEWIKDFTVTGKIKYLNYGNRVACQIEVCYTNEEWEDFKKGDKKTDFCFKFKAGFIATTPAILSTFAQLLISASKPPAEKPTTKTLE